VEIRKVQKLGTSSLIITLPKTWVNRLGIKPGDSVYLVEKEKELRIVPFYSESGFSVALNVDRDEFGKSLEILKCSMQLGFSNIRMKADFPLTSEMEESIRKVVLTDGDYEVNRIDPFTIEVSLITRMTFEDIGAMIREVISLLEKSFSLISEAIESPTPDLLEKLEKIQELFERRKLSRKHIARIIEGSRGDLIEERRVCSFVSSSYSICMGLSSTHRALLEIIRKSGPENLVSKEHAELMKGIFSGYLNVIWETIGALTNESLKRVETARSILGSLMKDVGGVLSEDRINGPLRDIVALIFNSTYYFDMLLSDIYCYIESKKLQIAT